MYTLSDNLVPLSALIAFIENEWIWNRTNGMLDITFIKSQLWKGKFKLMWNLLQL